MRMFLGLVAGIFLLSLVSMSLSGADQHRGAKDMSLDGGTSGNVPFPHHLHQEKLVDCEICHSSFPQESGAIERLKQEGKLAKKQIMNKQCTKCHSEKVKAGEKAGPVTCKTCHLKENS
jgi:hypothetical protein